MTTSSDQNNTPSKSKWPTGTTFVMYCAGITLILLAVSVAMSGRPFDFKVDKEGAHLTLHGGLTPKGIPEGAAKDKSSELQQQFEAISASTAPEATAATASAPFNGTWEGNGSTYVLIQDGSTVILSEMTEGITSAFGVGTANGSVAQLSIETVVGTFSVELVAESDTEIKISGPAIPQSYYIRKL